MSRAGPDRPPRAVVVVVPEDTPPGAVDEVCTRAVAQGGVLHAATPASGLAAVLATVPGDGDVVVLDGDWLAPATVYGDLVADPRPTAAVLFDPGGAPVGVSGRRLPAVALPALADHLVSTGPVRTLDPGPFPTARIGTDLAAARARVDAADEAALRLRRASRSDDGFLSAFLIRPLSRQVTRRLVGTGATPAGITGVSLSLGLASAVAYAGGSPGWLVLGSLLLLVSLVVDCVDGEVARYTRTFSALGGWLDVASDRVKEYAVYAGLVVGTAQARDRDLWGLALAAMAVLVTRHFVDFGFAGSGTAGATGGDSAVAQLSASTSRRPALVWAKRAVIMPVGERTVLLVVVVPLLGARAALLALLVWGLVAGAYTTAGRLGRSWGGAGAAAAPAGARERLQAQCDAGPVHRWPVGGRLGWLWPAVCRALECAAVVGLCWWAADSELFAGAYAVLAAAAFRLYDVVYRQRLAGVDAARDALRWVGWPARVAVVAVVALATRGGWDVGSARGTLVLLAGVLAVGALVSNVRFWRSRPRGATAP